LEAQSDVVLVVPYDGHRPLSSTPLGSGYVSMIYLMC
jgi:hypothetical protein